MTEQLRTFCQLNLSPTFFELTTAPAFQHFADSGVDVAVLEVGLGGRFDATHAVTPMACALALLGTVAPQGIAVTPEAVRAGLPVVNWAGRLEVVDRRPTILLDGAHNPVAAAALADYLTRSDRSHPFRPVVLVLGMMRDKDHRGFVEPLRGLVDEVVLTQANLPRSATAQELRASLEGLLPHPHVVPLLSDAMALARQLATPDGLVCVTGSLMLVGECKAWFRGCEFSPLQG